MMISVPGLMRLNDLNWNAVYGFWMVAEHGSFAEAARAIPTSVQSLHRRVRQLQRSGGLDLRLFRSRGVRGVELTEAGKRLRALVDPVFKSFGSLAAELRGEDSGPLAIGMTGDVAADFVPAILRHYRKAFPGVSPCILGRNTREVTALVTEGKLDLGVCVAPVGHSPLAVEGRTAIPYAIAVPSRHPLTRVPLTWERLIAEPLVLIERTSAIRQNLERLLRKKGLLDRMRLAGEVSSPDLAVEMAALGYGVAVVPVGRRLAKPGGVVLLAPPPGLPRIERAVIYRRDRYLPRYVREFVKLAARVISGRD